MEIRITLQSQSVTFDEQNQMYYLSESVLFFFTLWLTEMETLQAARLRKSHYNRSD